MDSDQRQLRGLALAPETRSPVWLPVAAAGLCLVVALVVPDLRYRLAALGLALGLGAMALLSFFRPDAVQPRAATQSRSKAQMEKAVAALIEHDSDAAFLTNIEGDIRSCNAAATQRFGKIPDDHITSAFARILANPEAVLYRLQTRALSSGSAKEDIVTRNGHYRLSVVQIGEDAHLWRFDDVGKSSRGTGRAADALTLPMMTVGASEAILYVNDALKRLLGPRPKSLSEVFGDGAIRSGDFVTIETLDGPVDVLVAIVPGAAGRREFYLLRPDHTIEQPQRTHDMAAGWDAIEDLPVPLLKVSPDGTVDASNREARALLGLEPNETRALGELLDGLGRPITDWLKEAMNGKGLNVSQFLRGRGAFSEVFVQVTLNTARGDDGKHLIAVLNDVTELKTLEAQFVQSQKMQAIGQLAGGVAHDFNNLLTAISGHCDLLLLRHDQGDQDYGDLIQIHQNANRAAALVGQLLAFSRKQNLQPERIDLRDTLSELTHLLNRLVGEKVRLVLDHDPDLAMIKADKRQLEQVMMNLVVNARDAMPDGGQIMVRTENVSLDRTLERDRAKIPPGDYVVVRVSDEGHGIPPERLPKIFEPFYTSKRTGEGTGLGLSTVYGIVKQTGGYVFAESDLKTGTEFQLYFPADILSVAETPLPAVTKRDEPTLDPTGGVVLLVEDEAPVRAFASRALRLKGYTVLEADSAETALDLLSDPDLEVDIFVTDVIMPGKDGPTWVREALEQRPDTRVVFVSGYAEDAFTINSDPIPNSVFLPKPFSLNDLAATVQGRVVSPI